MSFIQQNLRQYLPTNVTYALMGVFPDNTAQLFNGINYQYIDKVWNIQIAWDKNVNDIIQGVFIRMHSRDSLYGYHFTRENERMIDIRTISYPPNGIGPSELIIHMLSCRLVPDVEVPRYTFNNMELDVFTSVSRFFERVDHIFPEYEMLFYLPYRPQEPSSPHLNLPTPPHIHPESPDREPSVLHLDLPLTPDIRPAEPVEAPPFLSIHPYYTGGKYKLFPKS